MKNILITFLLLFFTVLSFSQGSVDSEILDAVTYIQIKGDKLVRTDSVFMQINNRLGDSQTEISIYYQKGDKVSIDEAWIEDMNGNVVRKLKKGDITDRNAIFDNSLYSDFFVKTFELKHSTYPYRIFYTYKKTESAFLGIYSNGIYRKPLRSQKVVVETPLDRPVKYKQKNVAEPFIETDANITRYIWNYSYEGYKPEIDAAYNDTDFPELEVVPLNFKYGVDGSFESWETFGNWLYRLNKGRDELTVSEKNRVDQLIAGIDDEKEKAKILYKYLQDNTRYINVSIKLGGLQTYPAEYVCTNKYGDCKALVNYMKAMLKYIGIESFNSPIYASNRIYDVDSDFALSQFNHVILTVPFENDTVFLECTSKNIPFGYIHSSIQGRKALLSMQSGSHLVSIPSMNDNDVLCSRVFNVPIDINIKEANIKLVATERGDSYEDYNSLDTANKNRADKYLRNNILRGSFTLLDYKFRKEEDEASIVVDIDCKMQNIWKKYGNNIVITPFPIRMKPYEVPEKRKFGVQIDFPSYQQDTIVYDLQNLAISKIPQDVTIETPYGHYSQKYEKGGDNKLICIKSVLIRAGRYSLSDYPQFYKFITSIKNLENKNIYLEVL